MQSEDLDELVDDLVEDDMIPRATMRKLDDDDLHLREDQELYTTQASNDTIRFSDLPPEITSSIFLLCIPITSLEADLLEMTTPWLLGSVCHAWRVIAWASPRLWTIVRIKPQWRKLDLWNWIEVLQGWLDRSGQLPLFLSIDTSAMKKDPRHPAEEFFPLMDLVSRHSRRWFELELRITTDWLTIFKELHMDYSAVRNLKLTVVRGRNLPNGYLILEGASPKHLSMMFTPIKLVKFSWNSITHAAFHVMRIDDCIEFLRHASQLLFLKILNMFVAAGNNHQIPSFHILHRELSNIEMRTVLRGYQSINLLFMSVTLPQLRRLHMYPVPMTMTTLRNFFDRFKCLLEVLHLLGLEDHNMDEVNMVLESVPSLRHLDLGWEPLNDPSPDLLFQRLATTFLTADVGQAQQFLPRLESLHYHAGKKISWKRLGDTFGPLIDSDSGTERRPLSKIRINFSLDLYDDIGAIYMTRGESDYISLILKKNLVVKVGHSGLLSNSIAYLDIHEFMRESQNYCRELESAG